MSDISDVAREGVNGFETFKRGDEEKMLYRRRDGAPEWIEDLCHTAHGDGDMLPDDWRYECIFDALVYIAENADGTPADELVHDFADGTVDVYNGNRLDWLASHPRRAGYVDQARDDGLIEPNTDIIEAIGVGQYEEATEVFWSVWSSLSTRVDELGGEGDDDE